MRLTPDPSGYSWLSDAFKTLLTVAVAITVTVATAGSGTGFGIAILSGAAGGFAGGFTGVMLNGGNICQAFKAEVIGGLVGGASAGAARGIGKLFGDVEKFKFGREALRASAHGTVGGLSSIAQGGKFEHGFMTGSFSSLAGSGMQAAGVEAKGTLMVSSAVIGGTSSVLGGGKFSNGAITGAFTMWFNHLENGEKEYSSRVQKNSKQVANVLNNLKTGLKSDEPFMLIKDLFGKDVPPYNGGAGASGWDYYGTVIIADHSLDIQMTIAGGELENGYFELATQIPSSRPNDHIAVI